LDLWHSRLRSCARLLGRPKGTPTAHPTVAIREESPDLPTGVDAPFGESRLTGMLARRTCQPSRRRTPMTATLPLRPPRGIAYTGLPVSVKTCASLSRRWRPGVPERRPGLPSRACAQKFSSRLFSSFLGLLLSPVETGCLPGIGPGSGCRPPYGISRRCNATISGWSVSGSRRFRRRAIRTR
jgi:hypothetical protein